MADTVVNFLVTNLTQLLKDEAKLLYGVEDKVLLLQQELGRINAFLKSSEGKRDEHEVVKAVVTQIRDVAYEAQDVIDRYVFELVNHRRKNMLEKFLHQFNKTKMLHDVNKEIDTIKSKIKDIYDNKDKYDIDEGESAAIEMKALAVAERVQKLRSNVEEDDVVGFDGYAAEVTNLIVKGNTSCEVVSIIGMVGCGKTTLARKVYKDLQLTNHFDCCAWEFVTKEFNAKQLLVNLLRSLKAIPEDQLKNIKKKTEEESDSYVKTQEIAILKNMLREYLSEMSYLIVLDDMWSSQVLEEIGDAFPEDNMGSRILITSRSEEVASKICTTNPYKLQRLSDEDSWLLLSKKVFRGENPPPNLVIAGQSIASACKGLPLSIVVIAGVLRSKERSERSWEKVIGNVNWFLSSEDTLVHEIVKLSYESLPRRLKPCFLYFGIYPEDYDIPVRQLIHLWVAEGFITEIGTGSMIEEDIAEEYLEELIRRNLIQVESRRTDGGVKTCRIHDLLRDLCMAESIQDNFLQVHTDINILKIGKPRRLSLHGSPSFYLSASPNDHSSTHSLFSFSKEDEDMSGFAIKDWICKNFKLIRVLDMWQYSSAFDILKPLEESIHLRYIRLKHHGSLPNFICDLWNLETLDLKDSAATISDLPVRIWKLKRLRHLYMSGLRATLPNIPGRKILPNLQTLSLVCLNQSTVQQLEKGKFPNLRKLGVTLLNSDHSNPIEYLRRLQCLTQLNTLKIFHSSNHLTNVVGFPPNITKITLVDCFYLSDIVTQLGSVSKLRYFKVISTKDSGDLKDLELECIKSGCFPQLQVLKIKNLNCVSWNMGEGAFPLLRCLVFDHCELSTNIPTAEFFPSLQEIQVLRSSKEVVEKLQHLVANDSCKLTVYSTLDE